MERRDFLQGLLLLATGTTTVTPEAVGGQVAWLVNRYGVDLVLKHLQQLLDERADITFKLLRSRVNREARRLFRHEQAAKRRERHIGTEIIFRGSVLVHDSVYLTGRSVKSRVNGRRVLAGTVPVDWCIGDIIIPKGTKLVVDTRHVIRDLAMAEYAIQRDSTTRLHIWSRPTWTGQGDPPLLMRHVVESRYADMGD